MGDRSCDMAFTKHVKDTSNVLTKHITNIRIVTVKHETTLEKYSPNMKYGTRRIKEWYSPNTERSTRLKNIRDVVVDSGETPVALACGARGEKN